MPHLPVIPAKDFILILQRLGFAIIRQKGSHVRLRHPDGRITTVAIHGNEPVSKGLLRKIIREDLKMTLEDFIEFIQD